MHWINPESLKPLRSTVTRFLFNPKGDADGMLLANGLEAHFPPHLSGQVLEAIQTGDAVTLYGVRPRAAEMIACVAIESARGARIDDLGPPAKKPKRHAKNSDKHRQSSNVVHREDTVERVLHGPQGEVRGVLLSDGSIVRFPPHAALSARRLLVPGKVIAVRGSSRTIFSTTVIEAHALGKSKANLKSVAPRPRD